MAVCQGTTKKDRPCTMPAAEGSGFCYLHDPDPAKAAQRSRNASRAATLGNSKIGGEIRDVRLMTRDLIGLTVSGELDLRVKKRLTEITQMLQVYSKLAELEMAAGEVPKMPGKGYVALPEDTPEKAKEWAEREAEKQKFIDDLTNFNRDPRVALEAMK